jgi:hypothetical protein
MTEQTKPLSVDDALALIAQERLDVMSEGMTADECAIVGAYVLHDAVIDLRRQVEQVTKERDEAKHHRRMMLDEDLKMQTMISLQKDFREAEAKLAAAQAEIAALMHDVSRLYKINLKN